MISNTAFYLQRNMIHLDIKSHNTKSLFFQKPGNFSKKQTNKLNFKSVTETSADTELSDQLHSPNSYFNSNEVKGQH